MNDDLIKWKRNYLRELEVVSHFSPKKYCEVFHGEAVAVYKSAKSRYKNSYDSFYYLALLEYAAPLHQTWLFFARNHPFEFAALIENDRKRLGIERSQFKHLRDSDEDLFANLLEMNRYGLHLLFSDISVSGEAEKKLISAIEYGDFKDFIRICEQHSIDFSRLKSITGVFTYLDEAHYSILDAKKDDSVYNNLLFLLGVTPEEIKGAIKEVLDVGGFQYSDFDDERIEQAGAIVSVAFTIYRICSLMDPYESRIVDEVLTIPEYSGFSCVAQRVYYEVYGELPSNVTPLIKLTEVSCIKEPAEKQKDAKVILDLPLALPPDFFTNAAYIDGKIKTIRPLPKWVTDGEDKASVFASVINLLADMEYIAPSLGNRRLLASFLSGRRLDTNAKAVEWLKKDGKGFAETEKVMLWLCKFFYSGKRGFYDQAYEILWGKRKRSFCNGNESGNADNADETIKVLIEGMYPNRPGGRHNTN